MSVAKQHRMTVDEFLAWAIRQDRGKYELQDGYIIMQQSQTWGHADIKVRILLALRAAIERAGVPFYAAPDGMTVRINSETCHEPDALVAPLPEPERLDLEIPNPVIVVEVLSPSSVKRDLMVKLDYFDVASIVHYLVADPEKREIIWHQRAASGGLDPPLAMREGTLRLDPPGIEIDMAGLFGRQQP